MHIPSNLCVKLISLISITFNFLLLFEVIALHLKNTYLWFERFTNSLEFKLFFGTLGNIS